MRRSGFVALLILFAATPAFPASRPTKLVHVKARSLQDASVLRFLKSWPDIASYNPRTGELAVFATPKDLALLDSLGLPYQVQIADLDALEAQMRASDYFDHFHDYEECKKELQWAESTFPNLAKVYDIGDSWEKTQGIADRDILAIKISDNVEQEEDEPEIAIISNHHAREIITPEIAIALVHYLLERYGRDPYVTYLVDHRQIWIVPTMNPDGLDYVHTVDRWWRKNRRQNSDGSYGVDLNRNYGYMWGYNDVGSSPDPASPVYRGLAPFSEPETQAIRDLCIQHQFRIILSYHSYSRLYLYPWGYVAENTPDHWVFASLADSMSRYNGYTPGNVASGTIYLTNGDSDDWFYGEQVVKNKIFGFTPEVGTAFHPDTTEIEQLIRENLYPTLYAIWAAGEEPIVDVQPLVDTEDELGPYVVRARIRPAITITDSCVLDPETFRLHFSVDNAPFDSVTLQPTGEPDWYYAELPADGKTHTYRYYVTAWSVDGRRGAAPRCAPDSVFTFHVRPDTVGPTIEHVPISEKSAFESEYRVYAQIYDVAGVDTAWVEYRKDSLIVYSVALRPSPQGYVATIPLNPVFPGQTIWYRILARDSSHRRNLSVYPQNDWFSFRIVPDVILDFEANPALHVVSGRDWEWGVPTTGPTGAHSGMRVWATNLDGTYHNRSDSRLNTPVIDLTHAQAATFQFWHWYDFEFSDGRLWDGGNLKISVDGGGFQLLNTSTRGYDRTVDRYNQVLGGEPAYGGPPGTGKKWQLETFDLTPYAGHKVVIQFHFGSDANTANFGWYLDDVRWTVLNPGAPRIALISKPRNTRDTRGPYEVSAEIQDDGQILRAEVVYNAGNGWQRLPLSKGPHRYTASLPGQPLGTRIDFYLEVEDSEGNLSWDPPAAPDQYYSFWVTDDGPTPHIFPNELTITVDPADTTLPSDTLWIANDGLLDLEIRITAETGTYRGTEVTDGQLVSPALLGRALQALAEQHEVPPVWAKSALPECLPSLEQTPATAGLTVQRRDGFLYVRFRQDEQVLVKTWPEEKLYLIEAHRGSVWLASLGEGHWLARFPSLQTDEFARVAFPDRLFGPVWKALYLQGLPSSGPASPVHTIWKANGMSWLTVAPDSAVIPKGGKLPVVVAVNRQQLTPGTWRATLRIEQNVLGNETVLIPVLVEVLNPSGTSSADACTEFDYHVYPNYPNPFNPETTIRYSLKEPGRVEAAILNARGELVRVLRNGWSARGVHTLRWNARDARGNAVPSGVYFCRLRVFSRTGNVVWQDVQKMLLLR